MAHSTQKVYLMVDVETDGPDTGQNSMRSVAIVACSPPGNIIDEFYSTMTPLPHRRPDPKTLKWWQDQNLEQWQELSSSTKPAASVMRELRLWVMRLECVYQDRISWIAMPACMDHTWLTYYLDALAPRDLPPLRIPFMHCLSTMLNTYLIMTQQLHLKHELKLKLSEGLPHPHHALYDARQQSVMYKNLRQWLQPRVEYVADRPSEVPVGPTAVPVGRLGDASYPGSCPQSSDSERQHVHASPKWSPRGGETSEPLPESVLCDRALDIRGRNMSGFSRSSVRRLNPTIGACNRTKATTPSETTSKVAKTVDSKSERMPCQRPLSMPPEWPHRMPSQRPLGMPSQRPLGMRGRNMSAPFTSWRRSQDDSVASPLAVKSTSPP